MEFTNPEILALKEALVLNRENLLNDLLAALNYDEINEQSFQDLIQIIEQAETNTVKLSKALEAQEVIDKVLKDGLI
jgi:cell division protein FtsX